LYFLIALCGYLSTFDLTQNIVLIRPPIPGMSRNYPLEVAIIGIVISLLTGIPLIYNSYRRAWVNILFGAGKEIKPLA
jgi:hypothetical protein